MLYDVSCTLCEFCVFIVISFLPMYCCTNAGVDVSVYTYVLPYIPSQECSCTVCSDVNTFNSFPVQQYQPVPLMVITNGPPDKCSGLT